ncbi:ABC transporter permease [Streptosporangium sp. NPDC048865]|uniref:ABC transporter permease n=1 Tax=Streptosporangium sp. NPDC048865 TaxID=3155766 RepID=UPI00341728E8
MRTDVLHAIRLAKIDLTLVGRNTTVLFNVLLLPLLMAWVYTQAVGAEKIGGVDGRLFVLAGLPGLMLVFAVFINLVNTFTARREELVLKRLRAGQPSGPAVLAGSALGALALYLAQVALLAVWMRRSEGVMVANVPMLVVVAFLGVALFCLLAAAFSGLTPNAELAQVTVLPVLLVVMVGAPIAFPSGTLPGVLGHLSALLPATPVVEIARTAFLGGDHVSGGGGEALSMGGQWAATLPSFAILLAWIAVAGLLARWLFRWEPRHG